MGSVSSRFLLEARRRAGITQSELARRAGIPYSVLSAYENGRREPGADTFLRLIRLAGYEAALTEAKRERTDDERRGRELALVLELAESLPHAERGDLTFPPLARTR
jgi:transcriptional regulator with XRE-family HTH domain